MASLQNLNLSENFLQAWQLVLVVLVLVLVIAVGGGFGGDDDDTFLISVASPTADAQDLITLENSAVNFRELHLVQQVMPVFCCQKKAPKETIHQWLFFIAQMLKLDQHEGSIGLPPFPAAQPRIQMTKSPCLTASALIAKPDREEDGSALMAEVLRSG